MTIYDQMMRTAKSRNPIEQQKKIRMQVENLTSNKKESEDFLDELMVLKQKRLKDQVEQDNINYLEKNILDVPVWQGLRNYAESQSVQQEKLKQHNAKCRKAELDK